MAPITTNQKPQERKIAQTQPQDDSLDFLDRLAGLEGAAKELLIYGQALMDRSKIAESQSVDQIELDRDLKDGSTAALRRVKERMNNCIDELIQHSLKME